MDDNSRPSTSFENVNDPSTSEHIQNMPSSVDAIELPYQCDQCGERFTRKLALNYHKQTYQHGGKSSPKVRHKKFEYKIVLKNLRCRDADGAVNTKSPRDPSQPSTSGRIQNVPPNADHQAPPAPLIQLLSLDCNQCGIRCATLGALNNHKSTVHEGSRAVEFGAPTPSTSMAHQPPYRAPGAKSGRAAGARDPPRSSPRITESAPSSRPIGDHDRLRPLTSQGRAVARGYQCHHCDRAFSDKNALHQHVTSNNLRGKACKDCGDFWTDSVALAAHRLTHSPFACDQCDRRYRHSTTLSRHVRVFHARPYECALCDEKFDCKPTLAEHLLCHAETKSLQCPLCEKRFHWKMQLQEHRERAHPEPEQRHQCPHCAQTFTTQALMQQHVKELCKVGPFNCKYCRKELVTYSGLLRHEKQHAEARSQKCRVCQKMFDTPQDLSQHMERAHSRPKKFKCGACTSTFKSQACLVAHRIATHAGITELAVSGLCTRGQRFWCQYCSRVVRDEVGLPAHGNVHIGANVFRCYVCGRTQGTNQQLISHLQLHTNNEFHACDNCEAVFSNEDELEEHASTHAIQRPPRLQSPISCIVCEAQFSSATDLRYHQSNTHGVRVGERFARS